MLRDSTIPRMLHGVRWHPWARIPPFQKGTFLWYNTNVAPIRLVALVREGKHIAGELEGRNNSLPKLTLHYGPATCSVRYKAADEAHRPILGEVKGTAVFLLWKTLLILCIDTLANWRAILVVSL